MVVRRLRWISGPGSPRRGCGLCGRLYEFVSIKLSLHERYIVLVRDISEHEVGGTHLHGS